MTFEISLVLGILLASLVLFITEKVRMDVVALLVLITLALTGLVTPEEALAGFSNPAVVTVWAMFILSAALTQAGVAEIIGTQVLKLAGKSEARAVIVVMLTAAILSAFMNNIGVAALMLPVVITIANRTGHGPARLLMPLAYGSLLGGLTTLIGTPPNLVASNALIEAGYEGFSLFDFSPVGLCVMAGGILFVSFVGRHLLPRHPGKVASGDERTKHLEDEYALGERRFELQIPTGASLEGKRLRDTGLGSVLGLHAYSVRRGAETITAPAGDFQLRGGDCVQVQGRLEHFLELVEWQALEIASGEEMLELLSLEDIGDVEIDLAPDSELIGLTPKQSDFRRRFGVSIIGIRREAKLLRDNLATTPFEANDRLVLEGTISALKTLENQPDFGDCHLLTREKLSKVFSPNERLLEVQLPKKSLLEGRTILQSNLDNRLGLRILGIARNGEKIILPGPDEVLHGGDRLLAQCRSEGLEIFHGLQSLVPADPAGFHSAALETGDLGLAEATLSPRSTLVGKTLEEIAFRSRFSVHVLAIWRAGRAYRSHLRALPLEFGDALLLSGPRSKLRELEKDPEFLVITRAVEGATPETQRKVLIASLIMAAVVIPALAGWQPIAISAVAGVVLMVLARCISISEAYHAIEWKSVFLIAGMIPLGTALQTSGAARLLAEGVTAILAPMGDWSLVIGLYIITSLCTTIIPTTALVILMAPIAIQASTDIGIAPQSVIMAIAVAASASFTAPISHPVNVLVMGPGGYRFVDYLRLGLPLAIVVLICALPGLHFFWPLRPAP